MRLITSSRATTSAIVKSPGPQLTSALPAICHSRPEDRVASVPQRDPQAQPLLAVAETRQTVLAPSVRPRPGLVVRQVRPGGAVRAVVLADRPPLALAEVRTPQVPF